MTNTIAITDRGPNYHPIGWCNRYLLEIETNDPHHENPEKIETNDWGVLMLEMTRWIKEREGAK